MINVKTSFTLNVSDDSWLQISPDGKVTYRLNSRFLKNWNKAMVNIGKDAAQIAATYTPFSFFRSSWDSKVEYANKGMVSTITVYNKLVNANIKYRSQYADSGKTFNFPVSYAIAMLEKGRKRYQITPKSSHGWLTAGLNDDGEINFTKKTIKVAADSRFRTEPVTNAKRYLIRGVLSYFANVKSVGAVQAEYNEDLSFYKGNYKGGTAFKTIGSKSSQGFRTTKFKSKSQRYKNYFNGEE